MAKDDAAELAAFPSARLVGAMADALQAELGFDAPEQRCKLKEERRL